MDKITERDAITDYLRRVNPAVSGERGHAQLHTVCMAMIHGWGLTNAEALAYLLNFYNPRCNPPFNDDHIEQEIIKATKTLPSEQFGWLRKRWESGIRVPTSVLNDPPLDVEFRAPDPKDDEQQFVNMSADFVAEALLQRTVLGDMIEEITVEPFSGGARYRVDYVSENPSRRAESRFYLVKDVDLHAAMLRRLMGKPDADAEPESSPPAGLTVTHADVAGDESYGPTRKLVEDAAFNFRQIADRGVEIKSIHLAQMEANTKTGWNRERMRVNYDDGRVITVTLF